MSASSPIICRECFEERDIEGTFESRTEMSGRLIGICAIWLSHEICVQVSPREALLLVRRERMIITGMLLGLAIAALLMAAYFGIKHFGG